ncbi:MAG: hypothetical protein RLY86_4453, partial [Pseudomonadota bacterium]
MDLVIVVSLSAQGIEPPEGFEPTLENNLMGVAADRDLTIIALAPGEYVLLSGPRADTRAGPRAVAGAGPATGSDGVTDVRAAVLRTLNRHMAGGFGSIDLSRAVQPHPMADDAAAILAVAERHQAILDGRADGRLPSRTLTLDHLERLEDARRRLGVGPLVRQMARGERAVVLHPGTTPRIAFIEHAVDMDRLRREVIGADVDLRRNRPLFRRMGLALDRLTLLGFDQLDSGGHRAALNLWLESVFSQEFEYVANATLGGDLS